MARICQYGSWQITRIVLTWGARDGDDAIEHLLIRWLFPEQKLKSPLKPRRLGLLKNCGFGHRCRLHDDSSQYSVEELNMMDMMQNTHAPGKPAGPLKDA